jgi:hypothetical protein
VLLPVVAAIIVVSLISVTLEVRRRRAQQLTGRPYFSWL